MQKFLYKITFVFIILSATVYFICLPTGNFVKTSSQIGYQSKSNVVLLDSPNTRSKRDHHHVKDTTHCLEYSHTPIRDHPNHFAASRMNHVKFNIQIINRVIMLMIEKARSLEPSKDTPFGKRLNIVENFIKDINHIYSNEINSFSEQNTAFSNNHKK